MFRAKGQKSHGGETSSALRANLIPIWEGLSNRRRFARHRALVIGRFVGDAEIIRGQLGQASRTGKTA
jgi:hypothetical protein